MATELPETIGVIGIGTISSALVRGLCSSSVGEGCRTKFVLSPRNAAKAAGLRTQFPESVRVAGSNQEVVDAADYIVVAVLGKQAEEVLRELKFRAGQGVLSLVAALPLPRLKELASPAADCAIGIPLPAIAHRRGASLLMPPQPVGQAIFNELGTCVPVSEEKQFRRMLCITAMMGDFYKRQLTAQQWLEEHGVSQDDAGAWTGAIFATMAADSGTPGARGLERLVAEQTPGGLNEAVWRGQEADGAYEAVRHSLDAVHHRLAAGSWAPELEPASKRRRGT